MSLKQWLANGWLKPHKTDACRAKRNHVEYDYVQGASGAEAAELLGFVRELRREVVEKLAKTYPELAAANPRPNASPSPPNHARGSQADAVSAASAT